MPLAEMQHDEASVLTRLPLMPDHVQNLNFSLIYYSPAWKETTTIHRFIIFLSLSHQFESQIS